MYNAISAEWYASTRGAIDYVVSALLDLIRSTRNPPSVSLTGLVAVGSLGSRSYGQRDPLHYTTVINASKIQMDIKICL